mmetsp:Transcript_32410/g.59474  ORF Transcript_32410/g.59474 Transcript_32410/m.59474 type:complete len:218 (+) Transcript_32410:264-917(+)
MHQVVDPSSKSRSVLVWMLWWRIIIRLVVVSVMVAKEGKVRPVLELGQSLWCDGLGITAFLFLVVDAWEFIVLAETLGANDPPYLADPGAQHKRLFVVIVVQITVGRIQRKIDMVVAAHISVDFPGFLVNLRGTLVFLVRQRNRLRHSTTVIHLHVAVTLPIHKPFEQGNHFVPRFSLVRRAVLVHRQNTRLGQVVVIQSCCCCGCLAGIRVTGLEI